jgi:PilZ domain
MSMAERRRAARQKSFLRGCIYFNKRRSAVDCLIRDISEQGARIIFSDTISLPAVVELYIPQKEQTLRAEVQWRRGEEIGLAFPDAAAAEPATGDLAERVARLEAEIAALRRMIKHLKRELPGSDDEAA